jgi:conjugal transfer pilus assembly protein TraF
MQAGRLLKILALVAYLAAGMSSTASAQDAGKAAASGEQQGQEATQEAAKPSWWDSDVWSDGDRGFNWYPPDRKPPAKKKDPKKPEEPVVAAKPKNLREIKDLQELQREIKRIKETAIFDPTPQNVHRYLQAQEYVMSQSQLFADTARRVVWQNPDVDPQTRTPQANYSLTNQRIRAVNKRYEVLSQLGKTHGLVFFFKSDCPYCHDMAPVMRAMESQYGIEVLPISMDGRGIQEFPAPRPDNGISRFVTRGEGVQTVPAVYLVSNDKKTVMLVGSGALAMDEVAERVRVLMTVKPGQDY